MDSLPEQTYSLIRTAVIGRRPIAAVYHDRPRLLCPHRLGWNNDDRPQVLCYQYAVRVTAGCSPPAHQTTGAAWRWRNCSMLPYWMTRGGQRPTIPVRKPVLSG
jgi:hypothetical protein